MFSFLFVCFFFKFHQLCYYEANCSPSTAGSTQFFKNNSRLEYGCPYIVAILKPYSGELIWEFVLSELLHSLICRSSAKSLTSSYLHTRKCAQHWLFTKYFPLHRSDLTLFPVMSIHLSICFHCTKLYFNHISSKTYPAYTIIQGFKNDLLQFETTHIVSCISTTLQCNFHTRQY